MNVSMHVYMYISMYVVILLLNFINYLFMYVCNKTYLFHNCSNRNPKRDLETFAHTSDPVLVLTTQA